MSNKYILAVTIVMSLVTIVFRAFPFIVMKGKETPDIVIYLGNILPYSIMGMLLIYCLKDVNILKGHHGIPEALAILVVVILHKWKHNTMLSLSVGTLLYMLLVQNVFV